MTRSRAIGIVLVIAATLSAACSSPTNGRRVIVLGFDGLDYEVTRSMMAAGKLPALARLAEGGSFAPLTTTIPPQSPVAWASFITGLDPGGHGIFDFVHRDPRTMQPYLSTARTVPAERTITAGRWQLPLSGARVESLRKGEPFWSVLEARGVPATIIRMPANFPPSGGASHELSGMGTPDLLGTYGTFAIYSSDGSAFDGGPPPGGVAHLVRIDDGIVSGTIEGPPHPFLRSSEPVRMPFSAEIDRDGRYVKLSIDGQYRLLAVGEWTDWIPIRFALAPTQSLKGIVRFYLKSIAPAFQLYVSPINIDPMDPAMPISHPDRYASELADTTGRYYTQGLPEETKALKAGVLTRDEFLEQARSAGDENLRQYRHVLGEFTSGLLFYYFGNADQVSHMMWRARDAAHPAYDPVADARYAGVVDERYRSLDAMVELSAASLGPDDLLVVMSDHGFTSWRRTFHLNSWLRDEGYLVVRDRARVDDPGLFANVDWSRTRAYGLGLNGLYVNVKGREVHGSVDPAEREALVTELAARLRAVIDPATALPAVSRTYRREDVYQLSGNEDVAPDLIVGYARGVRGSDESALGALTRDVLADNTSEWSGDHCMDHLVVPGILLASRPLRRPAASIQELAASLLAEFGIDDFPRRGRH